MSLESYQILVGFGDGTSFRVRVVFAHFLVCLSLFSVFFVWEVAFYCLLTILKSVAILKIFSIHVFKNKTASFSRFVYFPIFRNENSRIFKDRIDVLTLVILKIDTLFKTPKKWRKERELDVKKIDSGGSQKNSKIDVSIFSSLQSQKIEAATATIHPSSSLSFFLNKRLHHMTIFFITYIWIIRWILKSRISDKGENNHCGDGETFRILSF